MPFADFQPAQAPATGFQIQNQAQEAFGSMMERAQRLKINAAKHEMEKQSFAADMATSGLQQDSIRQEIATKRLQFSDLERTTRETADLRTEYNAVSPKIGEMLRMIQDTRDPFAQRRLMSQLVSQSAKFSRDPALRTVLDKQFGATISLIEANEDSKLSEHIETNQFAVTEADAVAKFPGQALRVITRPSQVPGGPSATFFLPTGKADPQLESQAFAQLRIAQATGDLGQMQAIMKDPAVQTVMRVPGSTFATEYTRAMQTTVELARKRQTEDRAAEDQDMQRTQVGQKKNALTVTGYEGSAKTEIEAQKFRELQKELGGVLEGLDEVTRIGKEYETTDWSSDPLKKNQLRALAEQQVGMIVGALRIPITGPGAMTDDERKFIEKLNGNPTKIFSLSKDEFAKLDSMKKKFNSSLDRSASVVGLGPRTAKASAPVSGSRAQALARGAAGSSKTP